MRIRKIESFAIQAPIHEPYQLASGKHDFLDSVFVRVHTEDGIVGIGEAFHSTPGYSYETKETILLSIDRYFGPVLLSIECDSVEMMLASLDRARSGHPFAKSLLEMAVFDALGKEAGLSVSALLGGPCRSEIGLCAGVGIRAPQAMADKACRLVEAGFDTIKIKIAGESMDEDVERVRLVREAIGLRTNLRVDANACYDLPRSMRLVSRIEQFDIEHLEQPLPEWDFRGMAILARDCAVPIMADEAVCTPQDVVRIASEQAADLIKIKVTKVGGFHIGRKILATAEACGLSVVVGQGLGTSVLAFAEIHLAASSPSVVDVGEMNGPLKVVKDPTLNSLTVQKGRVQVPTSPGLGIELDDDLIEQFVVRESYRCLER